MADHSDLIAEIPHVEKMSTQERLKHAKKRRSQQLKKWQHYEKQMEKESFRKQRKTVDAPRNSKSKFTDRKIAFISSVVLLEAAARSDLDEVRHLLRLGVSPDVSNEDGLTALHQCCIDDNESMVLLLMEHNVNVNARDSESWTPLHAAATCGHIHLCKVLIDAGADLLAVNADGNMPYDICENDITLDFIESEMAKRGITQEQIDETRDALEKQFLADLQKLATKSGNLMYRDPLNGASPLHIAAANGYMEVAEFLLSKQIPVDVCDNDTWQPIHAAACWCQPEMLELLVRYGANVDAKTRNGETPFDICEDPDLKQRILDLKDAMEMREETRRREKDNLHRRSHSRRSASVRRSSMRDKNLLSLKDAKDEAARFAVGLDSNEEEVELVKPEIDSTSSISTDINQNKPGLANSKTKNDVRTSTDAGALQGKSSEHPVEGFDTSGSSEPPNKKLEDISRTQPLNSHQVISVKRSSSTNKPDGAITGRMRDVLRSDQIKVANDKSLNEKVVTVPSIRTPNASELNCKPGTLSDLKKSRSEKYNSSTNRTNDLIISDTDSNQSHQHRPLSQAPPHKSSPTNNGTPNRVTSSSNSQSPVTKYTAPNNSVIGGGKSHKNTHNCCAIL